ncbi:hypothetical protein INT45_003903 [Circinella minor]|uniref:Uncharacterized protein n=1 Tax=Circinella minor TaxID=1195481 RepID=A0A8H7SFJ7_9FUNG|nr:hypothetical protein INT45_003903 [Circinella minor]
MRLEGFDHLNIERYIREYWHNQFDDDRVLVAMLEPEFKVGKNLFKDGTRFVCNEYPSVAKKKSDMIIKMRLPIRDVQPLVTPGSNQERFGGMSQLDEEMEVDAPRRAFGTRTDLLFYTPLSMNVYGTTEVGLNSITDSNKAINELELKAPKTMKDNMLLRMIRMYPGIQQSLMT